MSAWRFLAGQGAHESTALYWVPVSELFSLMSGGLISAQPSMLALLYAERAGLLRELPRTYRQREGRDARAFHLERVTSRLTKAISADNAELLAGLLADER